MIGFNQGVIHPHAFVDHREDGQRMVPIAEAALHPALHALHYGTCVFAGMGAYLCKDGRRRIFRPFDHCQRLYEHARMVDIEETDELTPQKILAGIVACAESNSHFVPDRHLYLRPTIGEASSCA